MKHKTAVTAAVLALFSLSACVEVRDANEGEENKVQVQRIENVVISEKTYLINGELVPESKLTSTPQATFVPVGKRIEYKFEFNYLEIRQGGAIYSMGNDLTLDIQDLDSQNGVIATFPEGHTAAPQISGISGGNLNVTIQHARGSLSYNVLGEKGGKGSDGPPPTPDMAGDRGGHEFEEGRRVVRPCLPGAKGFPGLKGAAGGNSGSGNIEIVSEDAGFLLNFNLKPGDGGVGGTGGNGGETGGKCRSQVGDAGPTGERGIVQNLCVQRNGLNRQCMY